MTDRVMQEIKRLQDEGPSADLTSRAKESARRGYETALQARTATGWAAADGENLDRDPGEILTRGSASTR